MFSFKSHLVLDILASVLPENPTIVEAGAFLGHTTLKMQAKWPKSRIYAFEPVPELFMQLQERTQPYPTISCYPYALSNVCSNATFYKAKKNTGATTQVGSLKKPIHVAHNFVFEDEINVETITLDMWAKNNAITTIDCLWFDMQGNELAALQGAQEILKTVRAVHVEVNFIARYENQPLYQEILAWFTAQGFTAYARDFVEQSEAFGNVIFIK